MTIAKTALKRARLLEREPARTELISKNTLREARKLKHLLTPAWFLECTDGKHRPHRRKSI